MTNAVFTTDAMSIVLNYVFPSLGVMIGTSLFMAPLPALKACLQRGSLGDLNPLPWSFMTGNTLGWVTYSFLTKDIFVFLGNGPALILSVYMNMGAIQLQYLEAVKNTKPQHELSLAEGNVELEDTQKNILHEPLVNPPLVDVPSGDIITFNAYPVMVRQMYPLLAVLMFWLVLFAGMAYELPTYEHTVLLVGLASNLNLIFFLGAPLSTIATVIRQKSAHSIHKKTMVMTVLNCFFWMAYGFAVDDPFIYTPNVIGLVLGLFQAALSLMFASKPAATASSQPSTNFKHNE